jgi:hypothetical protein
MTVDSGRKTLLMAERKIIQIAVSRMDYSDGLHKTNFACVVALCNDGSVWQKFLMPEAKYKWNRVADIPQDTVVEDLPF